MSIRLLVPERFATWSYAATIAFRRTSVGFPIALDGFLLQAP